MSACLHHLAGAFYPDSPNFDGARLAVEGGYCDSIETFGAPGVLMSCGAFPRLHRPAGPEPGLARLGGDCCTWDGRLDNRSELISLLGEEAPASAGDAAVALAIRRWGGDAALGRLIGDWSLALYDANERNIVLASDYAGVRPLYYTRQARSFLWSSSLEQLVNWSPHFEIDEDYVAEFLTRGLVQEHTPYRSIRAVPPGAVVRVSAQGLSIRRFWNAPASKVTRYLRESDYEDQLRILFREAVACRLDSSATACAELSGGLDSSSVVCMASRLICSGSIESREIATFSYEDEGSTDKPFYEAVERACTTKAVHLSGDAFPIVRSDSVGKSAPMWWEPRFVEIARRMGELQSSLFLTGQLGDLVMANWIDDSEQVADNLRDGQFALALAGAFEWSRSLQIPIYPILWRAAKAAFGLDSASRDSNTVPGCEAHNLFGDSVAPKFRKRADLPDRQAERRRAWRHAEPSRRKRLRALDEMLRSRKVECPAPLQHVSYTHPFLHRPLVEFMLTIPAGVACRPGEPRRLMRRAFSDLLPALILRRRSKGDYGAMFARAFHPLAAELLRDSSDMRLVECGYVDRASVKARLERLVQGLPCNESQLRCLILLEFWIRHREMTARANGD